MTLDSLTRGAQRHLQGFFDADTRRLATILCLPLVDGVFATMLVTGSLSSVSQMISVALTIFAGAGALAVVFSMEGDRSEVRLKVLKASAVLVLGSALVALVAPVYRQLVAISVMREVAAIALLVIAGKLAGISLAERVPVPVVVATGLLLAARQPSNLALTASYLVPAVLTAASASAVLFVATYIGKDLMRLSALKKGAAAVLVLIAASVLGVGIPSDLTVLTLSATLVYSLDLPLVRQNIFCREKLARTLP